MELTLEDKCVAEADLSVNEKGEWSLYIRTDGEGAIISADELRWMVKQIDAAD